MLEELGEQPLQGVVEANPALHDVELDHPIRRFRECHVVENHWWEPGNVSVLVLHGCRHKDMVHDGRYCGNELRDGRPREGLAVDFDDPRQRQSNVELEKYIIQLVS